MTVNEELKTAFIEAAKAGKLRGFLKKQGCESTEKELKEFFMEQQKKEDVSLTKEELESVAGGLSWLDDFSRSLLTFDRVLFCPAPRTSADGISSKDETMGECY